MQIITFHSFYCSIQLTCYHYHLPLPCGQSALSAVPTVSAACRAHSLFCEESERILFISPAQLSARLLPNGTVLVRWRYTSRGWRAPHRLVRLLSGPGREVFSRQLLLEEGQITLPPALLDPAAKYSLVFQPGGPGVPQAEDVGVVSAELALLSLLEAEHREEGGGPSGEVWGAFVSEVGLTASVDWEGAIRVEWRLARAAGTAETAELQYRQASSYRLTLRIGEGKSTFVSTQYGY
jgi:hypothetical protein